MKWKLLFFYRKIKSFLSSFKPRNLAKKKRIKRSLKAEVRTIKNNLHNLGYRKIKNNNVLSWKYYSDGGYRISFNALYNREKVFIKIGTPSQKIENSIKALEYFGNKYDFSPKGEKIVYQGRSCFKTEYINAYSFYEIKDYISKHINDYVEQAVLILDKLNETKTVHCDVETYNLIFRKKDKKMILIDYDTANSLCVDLKCAHPPRILIPYRDDKTVIFDDAYSFYYIFKRLLGKDCQSLEKLKIIIGRNIFKDT